MDDRNVELIAEALDLSADGADGDARRACVDELLVRGGPNVLMLAVAMTHGRGVPTRHLGAEVLAGLAASSAEHQVVGAAHARLVEMIATEGDPGVVGVVIAALCEVAAEADAQDAGATPG